MNTKNQEEVISSKQLRLPRAISLSRFLENDGSPYFRLIECRASESLDILIIEVDVEVSQRHVVDISPIETVELSFNVQKDSLRGCRPIRNDFPMDAVHIMIGYPDNQPYICLWDRPFEELKPTLTPYALLARIKYWLEKTADGTLHEIDQPLEPVLLGSGIQAIIPADIENSSKRYVAFANPDAGLDSVIQFVEKDPSDTGKQSCILASFTVPPIEHRAVQYVPTNLKELHEILARIGFDLSGELKRWIASIGDTSTFKEASLVLLLSFPKMRMQQGVAESIEYWGFIVAKKHTITQVGEALGAFIDASSYGISATGVLLGDKKEEEINLKNLEKFNIFSVVVQPELKSEDLPILSGYSKSLKPLLTAVGVGAVGSSILELAVRAGFGEWNIVDKDVFLPHNVIRHILGKYAVGRHKVECVEVYLNALVPGNPIQKAIVADIKNPRNKQEVLDKSFNGAEMIVDFSASVVAARQLCEHESKARRCSVFLNPTGKDLVFFIESSDRSISLWDIEGSYYAALHHEMALDGHLTEDASTNRYGNGCRDITTQISAAQTSILSGIAFPQMLERFQSPKGFAAVWRSDLQSGEIKRINIAVSPAVEMKADEWRIRWNSEVLAQLFVARQKSLPNETGGILLGLVDLEHKMISISAHVFAPVDSVQRPYGFERGVQGLEDVMNDVIKQSDGQLRYIGEWHSHPDGVAASPSKDDENVFQYLSNCFDISGEPYCMAIINNKDVFLRTGSEGKQFETKLPIPKALLQTKGEIHELT